MNIIMMNVMKEAIMDFGLLGKRAFVTGSSSGIGKAIAELLAAEGAAVVVHGRDEAKVRQSANTIEAAGGRVAVVVGDLADAVQAASVAHSAERAFGGLDILVNNAGAAPLGEWLDPTSEELWVSNYIQNVVSSVRMINGVIPGMVRQKWGRVVQIGSVVANMPASRNPHYHATKAAIANLTVSLSKQLAGTGVTVNTVSPGLIATPATKGWMLSVTPEHLRNDEDEVSQATLRHLAPNLVGRVGTVDDVSFAVAFLASENAAFVNGANIRVDGGANPTVN